MKKNYIILPYILNESRAELIKDGKSIGLSAKELKILSLFAHNQNQIISKENYGIKCGEKIMLDLTIL